MTGRLFSGHSTILRFLKNDERQKYSFQKIELGASLPLSVRTRVSVKPFVGYTNYTDLGPDQLITTPYPVFAETKQQFYAGGKIELTYDNSLTTGMNLIEGTRAS